MRRKKTKKSTGEHGIIKAHLRRGTSTQLRYVYLRALLQSTREVRGYLGSL